MGTTFENLNLKTKQNMEETEVQSVWLITELPGTCGLRPIPTMPPRPAASALPPLQNEVTPQGQQASQPLSP